MNKMKLSEAIRKGSLKHEQTTGTLWERKGNKHYTCALGAAYEGYFNKLPQKNHSALFSYVVVEDLKEEHNIDLYETVTNPVIGNETDLYNTILYLNDVAKWTREQIADWLETIGK